jgi:hypothetical protein
MSLASMAQACHTELTCANDVIHEVGERLPYCQASPNFDGLYDATINEPPLIACTVAPDPMNIIAGVIYLGDPNVEDSLQGTVASDGTFTGSFNYCDSPTLILLPALSRLLLPLL